MPMPPCIWTISLETRWKVSPILALARLTSSGTSGLSASMAASAASTADLELARSCVEAALTAIDNDSPDVPELVSLAKAKVGDTLHLVSNEMVQMHGGIGMTDAHDAGFYLKRARAAEATFGGQAYHRDRYARINGY